MLVRQLIKDLLEMPMDAEVVLSHKVSDHNYCFHHDGICVVEYLSTEVGIFSNEDCVKENNNAELDNK